MREDDRLRLVHQQRADLEQEQWQGPRHHRTQGSKTHGRASEPEPRHRHPRRVPEAEAQADRLSALTGDLLDLSRLDAGVPLRSEMLEAGELARSVVAELSVRARELRRDIALDAPRPQWAVGDPGSADFFFCGGDTASELPYCSYHSRVAYQPATDRRRDKRPPPFRNGS